MAGLARICKIYGSMKFVGNDGKEVIWLYDYARDEPRLKSEMTKEEIAASEKAKYELMKQEFDRPNKAQQGLSATVSATSSDTYSAINTDSETPF